MKSPKKVRKIKKKKTVKIGKLKAPSRPLEGRLLGEGAPWKAAAAVTPAPAVVPEEAPKSDEATARPRDGPAFPYESLGENDDSTKSAIIP